MLGIGHHLQKQTKMKILAEKAKEYNERAQELQTQNVSPEEIPVVLAHQNYERRHCEDPEPNERKMKGLGGSVTMAFEGTHKIPSSTQAMFLPAQTNFKQTQTLKSQGKAFIDSGKLQQQKEINQKMKHRIYQDHLQQMWDGMKSSDKMSQQKKNYVHNAEYQKELNNVNKQHFARKNDIKWYSEEYVKTKLSLRK